MEYCGVDLSIRVPTQQTNRVDCYGNQPITHQPTHSYLSPASSFSRTNRNADETIKLINRTSTISQSLHDAAKGN